MTWNVLSMFFRTSNATVPRDQARPAPVFEMR